VLRSRHSLALVALLALVACGGTTVTHGVPNLVEVEPGLWRGGQPTIAGWAHLRDLGVRTVIKLNFDAEDVDDPAAVLGMTVLPVPFPPSEIDNLLGGPTVEQVRRIVAAMADAKARPTYVHCTHGQDRTGLAVGAYRVSRGWPKSKAWWEMRERGFHELFLGLTDFWHDHVPLPLQPGATP